MSRLGRYTVVGTAAEVDSFRRALGAGEHVGVLPATFPIRWLVAPAVRDALVGFVNDPDLVLVHESQSFVYAKPLQVDRTYALTLCVRREAEPDRLFVDGDLADGEGVAQARIETILRLVAAPRDVAV